MLAVANCYLMAIPRSEFQPGFSAGLFFFYIHAVGYRGTVRASVSAAFNGSARRKDKDARTDGTAGVARAPDFSVDIAAHTVGAAFDAVESGLPPVGAML
jgi:hypothetical protein